MESCLQERACPPTQEGERDGIASSLETLYTNPLPMRLRKRGFHTARSFTFWRATEKGKGQKGTPFQQNSAYMADPVKLMTMSIRFWLGRLKVRLPKIWGWMLLHGAGLPGRSYSFLCLKGEGQGKPMGRHAHGYKPTPSGVIDRSTAIQRYKDSARLRDLCCPFAMLGLSAKALTVRYCGYG